LQSQIFPKTFQLITPEEPKKTQKPIEVKGKNFIVDRFQNSPAINKNNNSTGCMQSSYYYRVLGIFPISCNSINLGEKKNKRTWLTENIAYKFRWRSHNIFIISTLGRHIFFGCFLHSSMLSGQYQYAVFASFSVFSKFVRHLASWEKQKKKEKKRKRLKKNMKNLINMLRRRRTKKKIKFK